METQILKERLDFYLNAFEQVRERTGDDQMALVFLQQIGKDLRMREIMAERKALNGNGFVDAGEKPATQKQKDYLNTLGVDCEDGLTAKEASSLIDVALNK